jgi:hypothetical protein
MASIPLHSDVYPAIDYSVTAGTLKGKVAVIAGASRGIGQQIAQCLAKAGADVALLSISGNNADTKVLCESEGKWMCWLIMPRRNDDDHMPWIMLSIGGELLRLILRGYIRLQK